VSSPSTSRREQNKARTRDALLDALRTLISASGPDVVTVEQIAEEAGVSRRTFFNYFPSIEAALAEGVSAPLAGIEEAFLARPADEDPLAAVTGALRSAPIGSELTTWMYALGSCTAKGFTPTLALTVWQHQRGWLEGVLARRLGDDDRLRVSTLAAAIMAVFEATEAIWFERLGTPGTREPGTIDASATAEFNTLLVQALEHLRCGWTSRSPSTT
jgi:AcrR family transcriptional regulator